MADNEVPGRGGGVHSILDESLLLVNVGWVGLQTKHSISLLACPVLATICSRKRSAINLEAVFQGSRRQDRSI